jgi:hypothetical protein
MIREEGVIDSLLSYEPVALVDGRLQGPCDIRCMVARSGSEHFLNVFAERVGG